MNHGIPAGTLLRCPDWPDPTADPGIDIRGCGREFRLLDEDDIDDWVDCPHCGLMFDPRQGLEDAP